MLMTTELLRDVLCNEVIQISKLEVNNQILHGHISNMIELLMSDKDWVHIDVDVTASEIQEIAKAIKSRKVKDECQ